MRLLNPSLGRKTLGPLELLQLAAPRPQVGPMPRGGVSLGPAVSPPRWSTGGYVDPGTQIMQGLQAGLGMAARSNQSLIAQERLALEKQAFEAKTAETKRLTGARDALASGIFNAGLPSLVGDESDGAYNPPTSPQDFLASPEGVKLLVNMLSPDALAKRFTRAPPPTGFERTDTGLAPISGGPADLPYLTGKAKATAKPVAPTLTQQANSAEIETARNRIRALRVEPGETLRATILRHSQKASDTGRDNPSFDPMISRDFRIATQRMVGDDPGYAGFLAALDTKAPMPGTPNPAGGTPARPLPYQPPTREPVGAVPGLNSVQRRSATVADIGPMLADRPLQFTPPPMPRPKPIPGTPGYTGDAGRGLPPIERMDVNAIQMLLADPRAAQQIEANPELLQRLRARLAALRGGA